MVEEIGSLDKNRSDLIVEFQNLRHEIRQFGEEIGRTCSNMSKLEERKTSKEQSFADVFVKLNNLRKEMENEKTNRVNEERRMIKRDISDIRLELTEIKEYHKEKMESIDNRQQLIIAAVSYILENVPGMDTRKNQSEYNFSSSPIIGSTNYESLRFQIEAMKAKQEVKDAEQKKVLDQLHFAREEISEMQRKQEDLEKTGRKVLEEIVSLNKTMENKTKKLAGMDSFKEDTVLEFQMIRLELNELENKIEKEKIGPTLEKKRETAQLVHSTISTNEHHNTKKLKTLSTDSQNTDLPIQQEIIGTWRNLATSHKMCLTFSLNELLDVMCWKCTLNGVLQEQRSEKIGRNISRSGDMIDCSIEDNHLMTRIESLKKNVRTFDRYIEKGKLHVKYFNSQNNKTRHFIYEKVS